MLRITEGLVNRHESTQTQAADQVPSIEKPGNFILEPRHHCIAYEAGVLLVAGVVIHTVFCTDMTNESKRHWRQIPSFQQTVQQWDGIHITPIVFSVQKQEQPMGYVSRGTLETNQARIASGIIRDGVLLQTNGCAWIGFLQIAFTSFCFPIAPAQMMKKACCATVCFLRKSE